VTGGAGFIGSHITEAVIKDNEVVVFDNLSSGTKDRIPDQAKFIQGDIRDQKKLSAAIEGVDIIFHEAAVVSVEQSVNEPELTHDVNTRATIQLLELARKEDARVIFASSAAVYGHPDSVPISEDGSTAVTSPYGLSKLSSDQYIRLYADLYNLDAIALRYFNVYGPGQTGGDYSGVISIFFEQARNGGPITVHGDGSQIRDFVHVSDVVQANLLAAAKGTPGSAYNIGTGSSVSIRELADTIQSVVGGQHVSIEQTPKREGDIDKSQANITFARNDLGYEPAIQLEQGLRTLA